MPPADISNRVYSATYSNVPVYEFNVAGNHVMRRRADDWINATHILKVADFDKPARTRILEREVQKGVHEKVQGGYGKYQGTWVPLHDGRMLAERNGVLDKLLPIFDFVPGDRSPPPAPKHATAASNRPKQPRQTAAQRRSAAAFAASQSQVSQLSQVSEEPFEEPQAQYVREETPDNVTILSESMLGDPDIMNSQYSTGSTRKRKRGVDQMSIQDQQHQIWADALLDYFMLLDSEDQFVAPPEPPANVNLDRPIDEKGHSAMHWAAAMGDVEVVKELNRRGARLDCLSNNLETPLMRAVMFTNNYDKQTMPSMVKIFQSTVVRTDWFGSTVFHHIAATTSSTNKFVCARYYLDCIINKLSETWIPDEVTRILNVQDQNGDTAIMIAARNGARKCVRSLLGRNVAVDIPNKKGETADDLIRELNQRRRMHGRPRQASSSPFAPLLEHRLNGHNSHHDRQTPIVPALPFQSTLATVSQPPTTQFRSQTASHVMNKIAPTLLEKCEQLALAYEAELEEKDAEARDAERVVKKRQAEIEAIKKQVAELVHQSQSMLPQGQGGGGEDETDRAQEEELRILVEEAESLLEIEQRTELHRLVSSIPSQQHQAQPDHDDALPEKLRLALLLHRAQVERRQLVKEVVGNLSVAGMGEKQNEYKRLITTALGVREEDVEGMLPDILAELEEGRERERVEGLVGGSPM
ncbi:apses-domain-containing protein [Delitschia confertaspora ATCC 74209]|uniref:Apses-domain-containing protein n=1 Tax=Delitschia confertaspora ATCC 74209 TaxID=1513339 RepID=A0A9P4JSC0_9PLEO|nr:apses-domain-containing protein [Delitschia confertaspora ATCC 74209]